VDRYLTFQLSGAEYGLPLLRVREIVRYQAPTPLPQAPPTVRGMINLRGSAVPVIDLARKLGLAPQPISRRSTIILVETAGAAMGIAADSVSRVIALGESEVEPAPDFGLPRAPEYLRGLGKRAQGLVLLLDADRLLSDEELSAVSPVPIVAV